MRGEMRDYMRLFEIVRERDGRERKDRSTCKKNRPRRSVSIHKHNRAKNSISDQRHSHLPHTHTLTTHAIRDPSPHLYES